MENELDGILPPALLMITIAFLLHIIGNATTYYITIEYPDLIINSGLWKRCVSIDNDKVCYNEKLYAEYDWYRVCLAMSAFGFIALLASIACVGLRLFKFPENKVLRFTAILVTFSAVVFILIGTVLFVKNVDDITTGGEFVYGYSFALCISGMCLAALVDILLVIGLIMPKKNTRNCVDANSINNINF